MIRMTTAATKNRAYEVPNSSGRDMRRFSVTIVERSTVVTAPIDHWAVWRTRRFGEASLAAESISRFIFNFQFDTTPIFRAFYNME